MQTNLCTDRDLIRLYMGGNEQAFETLLNRHKSKIYASIYTFVRDNEAANDIFQETFIKVIDTFRAGKYNEEGKFLQWALRIAYNLCVDCFRKNKKRATVAQTEEFDIFDLLKNGESSEEDNIIRQQTHNTLRQLLDVLPQEQREVIVLRHFVDLTFKEIADLTNVSINTALGRMRYGLLNIRRMMSDKQISFH
jgi:RNA polymerase sigma factor (sigma-70 family)